MYKVKLDGYVLYHADHPSAMLTDPVLELEPGYAGVFTATVPPDNPLYDRIYCRKSMLSVFRNNTEIFYGEVRKIPNIDRYRNKQIQGLRSAAKDLHRRLPDEEKEGQ